MEKHKKNLILWSVFSTILIAILTLFVIAGYDVDNDDYIVAGVLGLIFYVPYAIYKIAINAHAIIKSSKNSQFTKNIVVTNHNKELLELYNSIKEEDFNKVGFVSFVKDKIKFSAKGKYGVVKDFNDKPGYHLAFNIEGINLVEKPLNYNDSVDYENNLFKIELGYFEDILLSQPENDNGIIVSDLATLEGKTIKVNADGGYISSIFTVESDDVDCGEIKFVKWNNSSKVIQFKFVIGSGVCDVAAGTVELSEDKQ